MISTLRAHRFDLLLLMILIGVGFATHSTNAALEGSSLSQTSPGELGPLPDGKVLRVAALGFDRLVADLFWLRTLNYIGDERVHALGFPEVARLGELVTDIDPEFRVVYRAMNSVLTVLTHEPDAAIALLEKGTRHLSWWKLHFLLSFNYFWEKEDWAQAAHHMQIAADLPGGPPHLALLAARLYSTAGAPETALAFVRARLAQLEPGEERESLERRLVDLWITRDFRAIEAAIVQYVSLSGEPPERVTQLVEAGLIEHEPRDPRGGRYAIEAGAPSTSIPFERTDQLYLNKSGSPS